MSRWHKTEFDMLPEHAFKPRGGRFGGAMTLEGGKGDAPAPDPRMGEAALKQIELNERIYDDYNTQDRPWMRDLANRAIGVSEGNLGLSRRAADNADALANYQLNNMKEHDARYWSVAVPYEDQLLQDSKRFDTAEYKQGQVDKAIGDVQQSFDKVQEQGTRAMMGMGINPNSGKFASAARESDFAKAKAMSDAANKTRAAAEQVGLATKMQMYGGMKGLAGLGATNAGLATSAMGAGLGAIGAAQNAGAGMMSAGNSYLGANNAAAGVMNSGVSAGISGYGNYVGLQQNAAQMNSANDPFNTILGAAAGVGTKWALGKV